MPDNGGNDPPGGRPFDGDVPLKLEKWMAYMGLILWNFLSKFAKKWASILNFPKNKATCILTRGKSPPLIKVSSDCSSWSDNSVSRILWARPFAKFRVFWRNLISRISGIDLFHGNWILPDRNTDKKSKLKSLFLWSIKQKIISKKIWKLCPWGDFLLERTICSISWTLLDYIIFSGKKWANRKGISCF